MHESQQGTLSCVYTIMAMAGSGAVTSPAIDKSTQDLSILPDGLLTKSFIDNYLKSKSKASGYAHISKGYKYFHEDFVKDRKCK